MKLQGLQSSVMRSVNDGTVESLMHELSSLGVWQFVITDELYDALSVQVAAGELDPVLVVRGRPLLRRRDVEHGTQSTENVG